MNASVQEFPTKWDLRFLAEARLTASWSKDPSTKVGAVIVHGRVGISRGFNGFPAGMEDKPEWYDNRDEKYSRVIHGEMNALVFAQRSVFGMTLYTVPFAPCDRCVVVMLQAGIQRFVFPKLPANLEGRWGESVERTKKYIREMGRAYLEVEGTEHG